MATKKQQKSFLQPLFEAEKDEGISHFVIIFRIGFLQQLGTISRVFLSFFCKLCESSFWRKYLISQKIDEKSLRNSFPDAEIIRRGRDEITFIVESKNLLKFGFKSSTDTDFVIRDLEAWV